MYGSLGCTTDIVGKRTRGLDLQDGHNANGESKKAGYAHGAPKEEREELPRKGRVDWIMLENDNEWDEK